MENRCNEWECPYNQNGKCTRNECVEFEDIMERIHEMKNAGGPS